MTDRVEVGVGVTCPILRIHPAILAQAAATTSLLLDGRLIWGVGTGENLNEHVLGDPWPIYEVRAEMLEESIDLIRRLWTEDSVTHRGEYFTVEDARILDRPDHPIPIVVSAFGENSAELAARVGDGLWLSSLNEETITAFEAAGGSGPIFSQLTLCWAPDKDEAIELVHRQWPNTGLPGQLNQELRTMLDFEQATELVTPESVAAEVPCGPDPGPVIEKVIEAKDAGGRLPLFSPDRARPGGLHRFLGERDSRRSRRLRAGRPCGPVARRTPPSQARSGPDQWARRPGTGRLSVPLPRAT